MNLWHQSVRQNSVSTAVQPPHGVDDHGVFVLSLAGRKIGKEKFDIQASQNKIEAHAEIELQVFEGGKNVSFRTFPKLILNTQLQPLAYTWKQEGPQASQLEVDFRPPLAISRYRTVSGQDDRRDFALPKDVVVLDDNVIHHYQLVVRRYRMTPGGRQTFKAFIPQEALPGFLTVEETGAEPVEIQGRSVAAHHLVVSTDLAQIDLWVDDQQHLQRVLMRANQFEAVR